MRKSLKPRIAVLDFEENGCQPGTGRLLADEIAQRLLRSESFQVVRREEWARLVDNQFAGEGHRNHPGWVAGLMILIGADAAVIGRVRQLVNGKTVVTAMLLDAGGIALAAADRNNAQRLAELAIVNRRAGKICARFRPVAARVDWVIGVTLLLNLGEDTALEPDDRMRIDRVLESVADPYFEEDFRVFGNLMARVGEVEILYVGDRHTSVRYSGHLCPKAGEVVFLSKI